MAAPSPGAALPLAALPHDTLRAGLPALKSDAMLTHPVERLQQASAAQEAGARMRTLGQVYGSALPARMAIEEQIVGRVRRLPGIPSSRLGLDALTGRLDDVGFEDVLGFPGEREDTRVDLHQAMEARLGMGPAAPGRSRALC